MAGASEIAGRRWGGWAVSQSTVILFFVCETDIRSLLTAETPRGPITLNISFTLFDGASS